MREPAFVGVVIDHLLHGIHGKRTAAGFAFQSDEDVIDVGKEGLAFLIQVSIQRRKGERIHEDRSGMITLRSYDVDATPTALNVLEPNGYDFTDSQTADPHQQHESAVAPAGHCTEKGVQFVRGKDLG